MEMNTITQKLTAISGRLARLMPVSPRGGDTLLTPTGGIRVEGMDDADRILSSPGSDGYRILDGGIYQDVPAEDTEAYLDAWATDMEEAAAARQAVALLGEHIAGGSYACGSAVAVSPHGGVTLTCRGDHHEATWDVDGRTGTVHHAAARALDCDSVSQDGGILWCGECDNVKHEGGELTVASGHVETTAPGIVRARTGARITIAHWVRVPRGASELEVGLRGALVPVLCGQARLFLATPRGDGPLPVKEELPEKLLPARLAASCGEAMDLQEMLGDFRLWRIAAPLNALRKVPGGWEATEAIVLEEITGREAIAQ